MENGVGLVQLRDETIRKPRVARSPSKDRGQALREGHVVDGSGCGSRLQRFIGTPMEKRVEAWKQATVQASSGQSSQAFCPPTDRIGRCIDARHTWGYAPDGWTGPLVRDMIQRLFAVDFHPEYVPRLLHQLGWSPQKPEQRARERNEADIARWRRESWPRLKKEP